MVCNWTLRPARVDVQYDNVFHSSNLQFFHTITLIFGRLRAFIQSDIFQTRNQQRLRLPTCPLRHFCMNVEVSK